MGPGRRLPARPAGRPRAGGRGGGRAQTACLRAAAGKALTTVFAGLALTMTTLPKTSRFPALVAGFTRVLMRSSPGSAKMPLLFTCAVAAPVRLSKTLVIWDFLSSHSVATASAIAPFVMGFAAAFMDFMGAMASGGVARRPGRAWRGGRG